MWGPFLLGGKSWTTEVSVRTPFEAGGGIEERKVRRLRKLARFASQRAPLRMTGEKGGARASLRMTGWEVSAARGVRRCW